MNETLIRRHRKGPLVDAACLLLAALLVGCGQERTAPKPAAPAPRVAMQTQPQPAPDAAAAEPGPADETVEVPSCDGENTVTVSEELTGVQYTALSG